MSASRHAGFLGALTVALPALALVEKLPSHPQILALLNNAAHAPVFGALAVVWYMLLGRASAWTSWQRYAAAFALTVATGGLIELIQPFVGRGAELGDLVNDALGAIACLALYAAFAMRRRWLLWVAVAALAPVTWPIAEASIAYAERARAFPTIVGNFARADRYFIHARGVEIVPTILPPHFARADDAKSLRIRIVGGRWPGVTNNEPQPDWRNYSRLMVDLTNPDSLALTLTLRVHDRAHDNRETDRFNRTFALPGAARTTLAIPLSEIAAGPRGRALDLSQVAGLILYGDGRPAQVGREFYLTRIWLE